MSERYLIDKSALVRRTKPAVRQVFEDLHGRGLLCISGAVAMEILYSARNKTESEWMRRWLTGFDMLTCPDEVWDMAMETQRQAYDQIAEITGHPSRWVAEPGTADTKE